MRFAGIIGNNATESTNRTLMHFIANHFQDRAEITCHEIRPLPAFKATGDRPANGTGDQGENQSVPVEVQEIINTIEASDGVIIATPEYNHTIPAPLKSLLEWLSWSSESMRGKPVMIVGASYGRLGTSRAQDHLRQILTSPLLRARVLPAEFLLSNSLSAFDESGALVSQADVEALEATFAEFEAFADIIASISQHITTEHTAAEGAK
ncbi:NADPH-dependent FMN reductase [Corynebacterium cystitidis]|uniref:NADPH-dependent FMN reductase n=1 Tax=Corynebacterium cystitidis TaxID=35757 RepID=UPI00211E4215|nr:NADPH-dependent FMN reductase [Corynebacterium cystitidis]